MNVGSTGASGYLSQMQQHSRVQSQSGASGFAPASSYGSLMQQVNTQVMTMLDSNKDGLIDKAEFSDAAKQLSQNSNTTSNVDNAFGKIDANSDGTIDPNELMAMLKQLSSKKSADQMSARLENNNTNQTQAANDQSNTKNVQSILMKNILAAYGNTSLAGSGLSLKA